MSTSNINSCRDSNPSGLPDVIFAVYVFADEMICLTLDPETEMGFCAQHELPFADVTTVAELEFD
jgi:hypothetical protein